MTAVEWLLNELSIAGYFQYGIPPKIEEQAKEMEYKQIIDARAITKTGYEIAEAEEYYFETYGLIHKTRNK